MLIMNIKSILDALSTASSKKDKEQIIKNNAKDITFVKVLEYTYNPYKMYYVKKVPDISEAGKETLEQSPTILFNLLDRLTKREITGHAALAEINNALSLYDKTSQDISIKVITKDLLCGINVSTINKVIPNLIPTFDVALANKLSDVEHRIDIMDGMWFVSRKMDGVRCITIKKDNDIKFYSREGNEFLTLNKLKDILTPILAKVPTLVLDGEVCIITEDGRDDFKGIMKQIGKKDHTIDNVRYWLFDCLGLEDFEHKSSVSIFEQRYNVLKYLFKDKESNNLKVLEQLPCTRETFKVMSDKADKENWEGLMVRKNVEYKGKRSNDLLKVKKFHDAEYKVLGIETGKVSYATKDRGQVEEEMMSAVYITHKGFQVKVGSGWDIAERKQFYTNPNDIIGNVITVSYFEETFNDKGEISLRFPTVKVIHGETRNV